MWLGQRPVHAAALPTNSSSVPGVACEEGPSQRTQPWPPLLLRSQNFGSPRAYALGAHTKAHGPLLALSGMRAHALERSGVCVVFGLWSKEACALFVGPGAGWHALERKGMRVCL